MGAGKNKLLLDWNGAPILEQVLRAWQGSRVSRVVVIVRPEDTAVAAVCARCNAEVLCPARAPEDMKQSIQHGLRALSASEQPLQADRVLIAPADLPRLNSQLIDRVIEASIGCEEVVVPRFGGRRGHPVSLPWRIAPKVFQLAADEGIDRIVAREAVLPVDMPVGAALNDVDTPADYHRLK